MPSGPARSVAPVWRSASRSWRTRLRLLGGRRVRVAAWVGGARAGGCGGVFSGMETSRLAGGSARGRGQVGGWSRMTASGPAVSMSRRAWMRQSRRPRVRGVCPVATAGWGHRGFWGAPGQARWQVRHHGPVGSSTSGTSQRRHSGGCPAQLRPGSVGVVMPLPAGRADAGRPTSRAFPRRVEVAAAAAAGRGRALRGCRLSAAGSGPRAR